MLSCKFCVNFVNFQEHPFCETPVKAASEYCQENINLEKSLLVPDLWFNQFIYIRSMKTKEMLLVRLQTQNEIRFDFLPLIR